MGKRWENMGAVQCATYHYEQDTAEAYRVFAGGQGRRHVVALTQYCPSLAAIWATEAQRLGDMLAAPAPRHLHQLALELSAAYGVQPSTQPDVVQGVLPAVAVIADCGLARWRLDWTPVLAVYAA
eukprot:1607846-Amphidinium_carterae.1